MSKTTEKGVYLTETILSIHNEVQSALDYISTTATEKGTELGKSTAILSIQNLRIKIPIKFNVEVTEQQIKPDINQFEVVDTIRLKELSTSRIGLLLQSTEAKKASAIKIGTTLASTETQTIDTKGTTAGNNVETKQEAWGEIEITFTPLKRQ
jgi:hypothetical protein